VINHFENKGKSEMPFQSVFVKSGGYGAETCCIFPCYFTETAIITIKN